MSNITNPVVPAGTEFTSLDPRRSAYAVFLLPRLVSMVRRNISTLLSENKTMGRRNRDVMVLQARAALIIVTGPPSPDQWGPPLFGLVTTGGSTA
jgi:hypothetical protein